MGNKLDGGNCIASKTEEEKTRVAADWYFLLPGHLTSDGNKLDGGRHNVIASKTILKFKKKQKRGLQPVMTLANKYTRGESTPFFPSILTIVISILTTFIIILEHNILVSRLLTHLKSRKEEKRGV